jgi:GTP-binding protein LepA
METNYIANKIRNFSIIAHIDHGKSTLADRILELTGTIEKRNMKDRVMDTLDLEQERGITIKLQTARMQKMYTSDNEKFKDSTPYVLNLVDTPGHVDFSYEVSRSLAASEGAVLLVDATQGIQAQTFTTVYKALEYNLEIIPVLNKIDLPNVDIDNVISSMVSVFGFSEDEIIRTSGKTGEGVEQLLNRIIEKVPSPLEFIDTDTKALIYDSFYHEYKGVVALVKIVQGKIQKGDRLRMFATGTQVLPIEIGYLNPDLVSSDILRSGEIGYIATGLKDIKSIHVGDTVCVESELLSTPNFEPLPDYKPAKPMVYAGLYPIEANEFINFKDALEKLALNDAALSYQKESSPALGSGYLCGFLGLLHMEITQERLDREFDIDLITTNPSVEYLLRTTTKDWSKIPTLNILQKDENDYFHIHTAEEFPNATLIDHVKEPWVKLEILTPEKYIGPIMDLAQKNRGIFQNMNYISNELFNGDKHVTIVYHIPTAEIITSFFDKLKSISQGYASMDYTFLDYRVADISKVNIIVNYELVEALSFLSHSSNAESKGKLLVSKLCELIPRQQIPIPVQAAVGMKVFARETIKAYRKDVLAKMSGGDITRKTKLLDKQKKGKKKLKAKMIGNIRIPQDVFVKALRMD